MRRIFILLLLVAAFPVTSHAQTKGQDVTYLDGQTPLQGYWSPAQCNRKTQNGITPTIIIVHQWRGLTDYEKMRADMLSAQCYNAFALDMYGQGIRPANDEEAKAQSGIYKKDPALALGRMQAAINYVLAKPGVDLTRTAAIGYCFGGGMVLNLARSGSDVKAVVSFHGSLQSSMSNQPGNNIKALVYAHHGAADPMVPPTDVAAFKQEMKSSGAKWKFAAYKGAVHAFTQPDAGNDPSNGVAYNPVADKTSWSKTLEFFNKVL